MSEGTETASAETTAGVPSPGELAESPPIADPALLLDAWLSELLESQGKSPATVKGYR